MKTLDRYIWSELVRIFIFTLLAFILIFLVVDVFERIDKFIDKGAAAWAIAKFFMYKIPYIVMMIIPVAVLLSALFRIGGMSRSSEITAVRAGGISIRRMFAPMFLFAALISVFALLLSEYVVPYTNHKMELVEQIEIKKQSYGRKRQQANLHFLGKGNIVYQIGLFDGEKQEMHNVEIFFYDKKNQTIRRRIEAAKGFYQNGLWAFINGYQRIMQADGSMFSQPFQQLAIPELQEVPADFNKRIKEPEEMAYFELQQYIEKRENAAFEVHREKTDLYSKIAFPLTSLIIVFFASPLAAAGKRSNSMIHFTLGIVIAFSYFVLIRLGQSLGYSAVLPPMLAAWLANLIFAAIGVIMLLRAE